MSRMQLAIGLANQQLANIIWDDLQNMTGTTNAHTIAATNTFVGATGGTVGFFGTSGATRQTLAASTNTTSIVAALVNLGLVQ